MYIKSARITNIRSIEDFEITFDEPAGWHVLIGDNGSGKSTIIRSLALALVGPDEAPGLRADWRDWLSVGEDEGRIELKIESSQVDNLKSAEYEQGNLIPNEIFFRRDGERVLFLTIKDQDIAIDPKDFNWSNNDGWFSAAYGPYRRFTGGDTELDKIYPNQPKLGAHLSALNEAAALTETTKWFIKLYYQEVERVDEILKSSGVQKQIEERLTKLFAGSKQNSELGLLFSILASNEKFKTDSIHSALLDEIFDEPTAKFVKHISRSTIDDIKKLINSDDFLPNGIKFNKVSSEGVFFENGSDYLIGISQLSDGYRSILSLTLELIRQLFRVYGEESVLKNIREDNMYIDLPGVVLIDEIDAHLHPTWQTKIGQWFLKYFPNLQFIVTTHSPLVCRAAEKGTIWKLAAPGSGEKSGQVTGIDRQRLIFGNILDAYGTEVFGEDVSRSAESGKMLQELAALNVKSFKGKITDSERQRADELKQILPTS